MGGEGKNTHSYGTINYFFRKKGIFLESEIFYSGRESDVQENCSRKKGTAPKYFFLMLPMGGNFRNLFGDEFAVLGRDGLLQRRDFLLELRDLGDVVGVAVAALASLLLRQLRDLGHRLVRALDLRHVGPLRLLVVVVLVTAGQRQSGDYCYVIETN